MALGALDLHWPQLFNDPDFHNMRRLSGTTWINITGFAARAADRGCPCIAGSLYLAKAPEAEVAQLRRRARHLALFGYREEDFQRAQQVEVVMIAAIAQCSCAPCLSRHCESLSDEAISILLAAIIKIASLRF